MSATKLLLILPLIVAFAYVSIEHNTDPRLDSNFYPGAGATPTPEHASWGEKISIGTPDG